MLYVEPSTNLKLNLIDKNDSMGTSFKSWRNDLSGSGDGTESHPFSNMQKIDNFAGEVNAKIRQLDEKLNSVDALSMSIVSELPTTNISTKKLYLVPSKISSENNAYTEYAYVNGKWEIVGSAQIDISMKEDKANKVTSISSSSTNTQYPSAKLMYDMMTELDSNISDSLVDLQDGISERSVIDIDNVETGATSLGYAVSSVPDTTIISGTVEETVGLVKDREAIIDSLLKFI